MKTGRPSKDVKSNLHIRIDSETLSKIEYIAKSRGITVSEYVREVLRRNEKNDI